MKVDDPSIGVSAQSKQPQELLLLILVDWWEAGRQPGTRLSIKGVLKNCDPLSPRVATLRAIFRAAQQ